jgi:hypothetical protein
LQYGNSTHIQKNSTHFFEAFCGRITERLRMPILALCTASVSLD